MRIPQIMAGVATSVLMMGTSGAHAADTFPDKPVRLVVPQAPGGASDTLARILAQGLSEKWHQPVVVENRAGAGGNVGMDAVARAPADGYTLLMSYEGSHAINGAIYQDLPFNVQQDFAPVATVAVLPFVAVTHPQSGLRSLNELVEAAHKSRLNYGSAGNGSVNHLLGEMFNASAGVKLVHVPYRGAAPAIQDLLGGRIHVVFTSLPSVKSFIDAHTLRALAVTSAARTPAAPNVPTIAESGYAPFDVNPWFGLFVPAGVAPERITRINEDVNALLSDAAIAQKFAAQGAVPKASSPEDFRAQVDASITKWAKVVRESGARMQ
ncbi:MAG: tripartite tricarboxylate transporter substrate binding protein [Burkholderiaceae bacterium]